MRHIIRDGGAMHDSQVTVIASAGDMQSASIVPHGQHVGLPAMPVNEFIFRHVSVEKTEDCRGFRMSHAFYADRVDGACKERLAARHGVRTSGCGQVFSASSLTMIFIVRSSVSCAKTPFVP